MAAAGTWWVQPAQAKPPNIVLLLADDLGWADLGCYGADLHESPHLDRLASEGVRFTHAFAPAPVCTPSRAGLLTGQHPARMGMTVWREAARTPPRNRRVVPPVAEENLPQQAWTSAEALRGAGYQTWHVGKWHLGGAENYPEAHGFDVNIGGTLWGAPQTFHWPYQGTKRYGGEFRYVPGLQGGREGEYLTDRLTDEAIRLIERRGDRPFFLNFWYHTVHTPIEGKPALTAKYRQRIQAGMRHRNAGYAAMVQSLDESVGRILETLQRLGLGENTLVVFTSDNGGYDQEFDGERVTTNAPLRSGKGSLHEGGLRVPLMVRGPGVARSKMNAEMVSLLDLYPTLLEFGSAAVPANDGQGLRGLLAGAADRLDREELFFHFPHYYPTTSPVSGIRTREWKLLEYLEDGALELFDLRRDPAEQRDVAGQHRPRVEEMHGKLRQWRAEVRARMPVANPDFRAAGG